MKKNLQRLFSLLLVLSMVLGLVACSGKANTADAKPAAAAELVNGDFEDVSAGQWAGWTRHDAAFNFRGVVSDEKVKGVSIEGGKYPLAKKTLLRNHQFAVSNEIVKNCALITVKKGGIYIIESKDL